MTALLHLGRRGNGAPGASAEPPDPNTLELNAVLLASEDRDISPEAISLAGRIAERSRASVHVLVIARIWGTSFGFPNPGLMPNKREWQEQRKKAELAVRALKGWGLEADGHVIGTRNAAKKIIEEARIHGCGAIVMTADEPRGKLLGNMIWSQEPYRVRRRADIPVYLVTES
jgi:nucleotide-binding universal stress UspA family protein